MGKSTLYRKYFGPAGYKHISQDVLGSRPKCIKATEEVLSSGKSCVIGMRCPWRYPNLATNHVFTQTTRTETGKHGSTILTLQKRSVPQSGERVMAPETSSFIHAHCW